MTYPRRFIVALFSIVAIIHLSAPASFSTEEKTHPAEEEIKALKKKVNELEKKIDWLDNDFDRRLHAIEKKVFSGQQQDDASEKDARQEINVIKELIANEQIALAREKLAGFFKQYSNTKSATSARKLSEEIAIIGKDMPTNWGIERWFQGKDEIDLKTQGTLLVLFWETWCGYCHREAPKIETIYEGYKDKGLQVFGITKMSGDSTPEKVMEFIKENSLTYPIAKENGSLKKYFNIRGIPAAALISKGKVVWRGNPARLPDKLIKKYLGIQLPPETDQDKAEIPSAR